MKGAGGERTPPHDAHIIRGAGRGQSRMGRRGAQGQKRIKSVPAASANAGAGEGGAGGGQAEQIFGGRGWAVGPLPQLPETEDTAQRLQIKRHPAITCEVQVCERIMRLYSHRGLELLEEYMRCQCGKEFQTYEYVMQSEQYQEVDRPMVRDHAIPLLKGKRRDGVGDQEREGHHKRLRHVVIRKSPWWVLQEQTLEPDVIAYRLLRCAIEQLQERMMCRQVQLEARAEDMQDPVTKRIEIGLIPTGLAVGAQGGGRRRGGTRSRGTKGAPDGLQAAEDRTCVRAMEKRGRRRPGCRKRGRWAYRKREVGWQREGKAQERPSGERKKEGGQLRRSGGAAGGKGEQTSRTDQGHQACKP